MRLYFEWPRISILHLKMENYMYIQYMKKDYILLAAKTVILIL